MTLVDEGNVALLYRFSLFLVDPYFPVRFRKPDFRHQAAYDLRYQLYYVHLLGYGPTTETLLLVLAEL